MEDMKTSASAVVGASEDSSVICSCCGCGRRAASWRAIVGDKKDRKQLSSSTRLSRVPDSCVLWRESVPDLPHEAQS